MEPIVVAELVEAEKTNEPPAFIPRRSAGQAVGITGSIVAVYFLMEIYFIMLIGSMGVPFLYYWEPLMFLFWGIHSASFSLISIFCVAFSRSSPWRYIITSVLLALVAIGADRLWHNPNANPLQVITNVPAYFLGMGWIIMQLHVFGLFLFRWIGLGISLWRGEESAVPDRSHSLGALMLWGVAFAVVASLFRWMPEEAIKNLTKDFPGTIWRIPLNIIMGTLYLFIALWWPLGKIRFRWRFLAVWAFIVFDIALGAIIFLTMGEEPVFLISFFISSGIRFFWILVLVFIALRPLRGAGFQLVWNSRVL